MAWMKQKCTDVFLVGLVSGDLAWLPSSAARWNFWGGFLIHIVDALGGHNRALQDWVLRLTAGWFALGRLASRVEVFTLRLACRL